MMYAPYAQPSYPSANVDYNQYRERGQPIQQSYAQPSYPSANADYNQHRERGPPQQQPVQFQQQHHPYYKPNQNDTPRYDISLVYLADPNKISRVPKTAVKQIQTQIAQGPQGHGQQQGQQQAPGRMQPMQYDKRPPASMRGVEPQHPSYNQWQQPLHPQQPPSTHASQQQPHYASFHSPQSEYRPERHERQTHEPRERQYHERQQYDNNTNRHETSRYEPHGHQSSSRYAYQFEKLSELENAEFLLDALNSHGVYIPGDPSTAVSNKSKATKEHGRDAEGGEAADYDLNSKHGKSRLKQEAEVLKKNFPYQIDLNAPPEILAYQVKKIQKDQEVEQYLTDKKKSWERGPLLVDLALTALPIPNPFAPTTLTSIVAGAFEENREALRKQFSEQPIPQEETKPATNIWWSTLVNAGKHFVQNVSRVPENRTGDNSNSNTVFNGSQQRSAFGFSGDAYENKQLPYDSKQPALFNNLINPIFEWFGLSNPKPKQQLPQQQPHQQTFPGASSFQTVPDYDVFDESELMKLQMEKEQIMQHIEELNSALAELQQAQQTTDATEVSHFYRASQETPFSKVEEQEEYKSLKQGSDKKVNHLDSMNDSMDSTSIFAAADSDRKYPANLVASQSPVGRAMLSGPKLPPDSTFMKKPTSTVTAGVLSSPKSAGPVHAAATLATNATVTTVATVASIPVKPSVSQATSLLLNQLTASTEGDEEFTT